MPPPALPPAHTLCIDLDGTLLPQDTMQENVKLLLRRRPFYIFRLLWWLRRGRAHFKHKLAQAQELPVENLPYYPAILAWLAGEKAAGRIIILASGTDQSIARRVADHLNLFTHVLGSDGVTNLTGSRKLARLKQIVGHENFLYVGDSRRDLPLWRALGQALVVNPAPKLLEVLRREQIPFQIIEA